MFFEDVSYFGKKKTPFCSLTERRTCPLPFFCHSQHTLVSNLSGNSSGSASSQIQPSRFPSGIIWICSTLQLRDSAGFSPAYLLSLSTPDYLIYSIIHLYAIFFTQNYSIILIPSQVVCNCISSWRLLRFIAVILEEFIYCHYL